MLNILLIEDEEINRITLAKLLRHAGHEVQTAKDGDEGLALVKTGDWDVVLTDLRLPGVNGMEILRESRQRHPQTPVLMMTAYATVKNAVECLKLGAFNYLTKPFEQSELFHHLEHIERIKNLGAQNESLRSELAELKISPQVIGDSDIMRSLLDKVKIVSSSDHAILIQGASGTGKELIANTIQALSKRLEKPFIKVNCSALNETLFESEMFGHEKGAFTGAVGRSIGRFERASGGTIFLDDIDDLSVRLQTKLLRVLQEGEIERVGGDRVIKVNVRILAATKVDLKEKVERNEFREDFYYRLNVVKLKIPELTERPSDIPLLINYFLNKEFKGKSASPELVAYLSSLKWPGNIRELHHVIQQMAVFSQSDLLGIEHLPDPYRNLIDAVDPHPEGSNDQHELTLNERVDAFEKNILAQAMQSHGHNQKKVAEYLNIPRTTLRSKLEKYDLSGDE